MIKTEWHVLRNISRDIYRKIYGINPQNIKQTASNFCVIADYRHREMKQIHLERINYCLTDFLFLTSVGPCNLIYYYNKRQLDAQFLTFILKNSTYFEQI